MLTKQIIILLYISVTHKHKKTGRIGDAPESWQTIFVRPLKNNFFEGGGFIQILVNGNIQQVT